MNEKTRVPSGLTLEKAMFVVSRAEESLKSTIDSNEAISKRAGAVLAIMGGAITLFMGALANHTWTASAWDFLIATEFVMLLAVAWFAAKHFLIPSVYNPSGIEPEKISDGEFLSSNYPAMLWGYSMTLQRQMRDNRTRNSDRAARLNEIVSAMLWSFPTAATVAGIRLLVTL